jgi:subtilisin family serine protease
LKLMDADGLWEQGYTGDGTVIAVLDSGLNTDHEAFADTSLMESPALSREDVAEFARKGGTKGRYVSQRIPFAYDYYSRDDGVATTNNHGTHVTALAAGYVKDRAGHVTFRGAAPAAQILSMKIFPNGSGGGTDDTIILRALEDAWNLGADVVNLSVGTGAGFSASDTMDGIYCRAFTQMARSGVLICCAAGNSAASVQSKTWGQPLPSGGYTDYGSVCSPGSFYGALAVAAASRTEDGTAAIADYSAWGPGSGLHLTPALTAFGGPVTSAGASSNQQYRSDEGTSMASPYAAGSFAVLLQSLREQGVTDKQEAAALAQSLLASRSRLLTENGLPVSPRRQGAGFLDLEDAASAALTVMNPLIELGESGEGRFALPVTLRNLSGQSLDVSLEVQALTDDYTQQDGVWYSRMTPRDITAGVTVTGPRSVTVPARGETTVTLNLTVSGELRRELAEACPNGFYVEGYVTASGGGQKAHGAFLGYCGSWNAAPVLEPLDFRDLQDTAFRLAGGQELSPERRSLPENMEDCLEALGANLGVNLAFLAKEPSALPEDGVLLGANSHAYGLHDSRRGALSVWDGNTSAGTLCLNLYTLRNAAGVVMVVSDPETGEVYDAREELLLEKSGKSSFSPEIVPSASFAWEGTDAREKPLPDGTLVQVDVYAWLDTDEDIQSAYRSNVRRTAPESYRWLLEDAYDAYRALSFPVTLDGAPPAAEASLNGSTLTVTVRDNQFVSYASVLDGSGKRLAESAFFQEEPGTPCTLSVSFSGNALPETVYVQTEDYAANTIGYEVDVKALASGETAPPKRCAAMLLNDVPPGAWYHQAVDYILEKGLMEPYRGQSFQPDASASRWEIVSALHRANGSPSSKLSVEDLPFHDVSSRAKYAKALCWAYEQGLVSGREDGAFYGTADVTRQELAVMLYRGLKASGTGSGSLTAFSDGSGVASWARDAVSWAVGEGLLRGRSDGRLNPDNSVTRAETAQILMRFLEE